MAAHSSIQVGQLDCTLNPQISAEMAIKAYPTILLYASEWSGSVVAGTLQLSSPQRMCVCVCVACAFGLQLSRWSDDRSVPR